MKADNAHIIPEVQLSLPARSAAEAAAPSRRGFLAAGALSALPAAAAGTTALAGAPAPAISPGPDAEEAEFIRLCNRVVEIRREECRIYNAVAFTSIEEERRRDAVYAPLRREWGRIEARLYKISVTPKTQAGISAVARAALAEAPRMGDGSLSLEEGLSEWLAWSICKAIEPAANAAIESQVQKSNAASRALAEIGA